MSITKLFNDTAHKRARRAGRGISGNLGKTAGRGTKGQKSRTGSGRKIQPWFEGGQTPLFRRLAKSRGFASPKAKPTTVTTNVLNKFYVEGETVSPETLIEKKVLRQSQTKAGVKIVKRGELKVKISFSGVVTSKSLQ